MSSARRIAGNAVFLLASQLIGKGLGFAIVVYLARTLQVASFGALSFAQTFATYFQVLINLGLDTFGTREVARSRDQARRHVDVILSIRAVAAVLAFGLLCATAWILPRDHEAKLLLIFSGLAILPFAANLDWFFQATERMEVIAASRVLQQLLLAGLIFLLVSGPGDLLEVPLLRLASLVVATLLPLALLVRLQGWPRPCFARREWSETLRQSLPIGFSLMMITVYYNADTLFLGLLGSDELVGWYNAAYRCVFVLLLPADTIRTAVFPALARRDDPPRLERVANAYLKTMLLIGVPIGFGGTLLGRELIHLIYGPAYDNAVLPLQILCWNVVLVFVNESYGSPLLAWGEQNLYTKVVTASAVTNVAMNFLLIPSFGMVGAASATILAELTAFLGVYPRFQRTVRIPLLRHALRPLAAALAMSLALLAAKAVVGSFFALLVLGVVVYFAVLVALGGLTRADLAVLLASREPESASEPA